MGCDYEGMDHSYFAVNIPKTADFRGCMPIPDQHRAPVGARGSYLCRAIPGRGDRITAIAFGGSSGSVSAPVCHRTFPLEATGFLPGPPLRELNV